MPEWVSPSNLPAPSLSSIRPASEVISHAGWMPHAELTEPAKAILANQGDTEKLKLAIERALPKLPAQVQVKIKAMLTPEALATLAALAAVWGASHWIGVGEVVDVILLGWGFWTLGGEALDVAKDLHKFVITATRAKSEEDIDEAAGYFARAISIIGVDGVAAILAHKAFKAVRETEGTVATGSSSSSSVSEAVETRNPGPKASDPPAETVEPKPVPVVKTLSKGELADWYKKQGDYFKDQQNLENHLEGTDFTKPVKLRDLPEGTKVIQYVRADGKPGMYFAEPGTAMEKLGIMEPPPRVVQQFILKKSIQAVESTASTLEKSLAPGVGGTGGGQQLIFPKGWEESAMSGK